MLLFIAKNTEKQWRIFDSKGLITIDKDLLEFGTKVGAFGNKSLNDLAMAQRLKAVRSMLFREYLDVNIELRTKVKISNWSWETSYDGTAHGDGRVVNTLDYSVSGIKYTVSYYDRSDNFMGNDDGSISKTHSPGEKYNFSFWSSNVKYPHTARIRLDFSDKMIFDIIQEKWYTGNEYKEYIKEK